MRGDRARQLDDQIAGIQNAARRHRIADILDIRQRAKTGRYYAAGLGPQANRHERIGVIGGGRSKPAQIDERAAIQKITARRTEEHTSELQSIKRNSSAVLCLEKKKQKETTKH